MGEFRFQQGLALLALTLVFPLFQACRSLSDMSGESSILSESASPCLIRGIPAPPASCEAEDGLIVIGEFNPERPTVIFAHGWIPSYEMGVPDFVNAGGWQAQGFNTIMFRFIRRASDAGEGEICRPLGGKIPLFDLIEIKCPRLAEQRTWQDAGIAADFLGVYREFFSEFTDYRQEIRFIGHSLGAQIVTATAYALYQDAAWQGPLPQRIELLDPWVGNGFADTGLILAPRASWFPEYEEKAGSACGPQNADTSYCAVENALWRLQNVGVAILIYGSNASGAFAYDLRKFFPYQAFHADWLCSKPPLAQAEKCLFRGYSMFTAQHFYPLLAYFWSIEEPEPQGGFSARTPSSLLRQKPGFRKQLAGQNFCELPAGVPWWREGGLDHVFGMTRYPGQENRGYQQITANPKEFVQRMMQTLGLTQAQAEQCAAAISLSNDRFQ